MSDVLAVINFTKVHHDTYPFISSTKADLSGRHVLITGASKGIGRALAISFAQAGTSGIALLARSSTEETAKLAREAAAKAGKKEPNLLCVKCDTTSEQDVDAAAAKVSEAFGKLDVVVNNAGYLESFKPVADSDPADWWKSWEVNIKGTYLVSRAFIPQLLKTSQGSKILINVTSMGAVVTWPNASAYQSSKTAMVRVTDFLCAEYKEDGLLAFSVHPGGVLTELATGMPKEMHKMLGDTPELAGDTIVWLVGERREWLSGRFVNSQWDMEEFEGRKDEIVKDDLLKFKMAV